MSVELSVIVITRNEQARIGSCLQACFESVERAREAGLLTSAEVILSDSASTDHTIEIARAFPITVVELPSTWPLSAAAGRFVGLRHAHGGLILFVDGDYVLRDDWLPAAIIALREDSTIAAVAGKDIEDFTGDSVLMRQAKALTESSAGELEAVPVGLYRRSSIAAVGGLHPFLVGGEDRDLAHRLRNAGYRLVRINQTMGVHRWAEDGALDYITYFRSAITWSIGDGQVLRARIGVPSVRAEMRRRYASARHLLNYFVALVLLATALTNIISISIGVTWPAFVVDAMFVSSLLWTKASRLWSWSQLAHEFHVIPYSTLRHVGFILGFARKPRDPSQYPSGEHVMQAEAH